MKQPSKLSASDLESLHDQVIPFFTEKWDEGSENERFRKGKHWTDDQERKIKDQNRQPYSMAAIATKLHTIFSTQRQARTQFKVEAKVDPNDEIKAEVATLMLRDSEKSSKFKYIESEVFEAGVGVKYGAGEVYVDYSQLEPRIKFRKLDYKNVVWDTNSREYDVWEDGLFIAKIDRVYRYQLKHEYPEVKFSETSDEIGREKHSYYVTKNPNGQSDFDIISKFTHYQKVIRKYYYVIFPDTLGLNGSGIVTSRHNSEKEAEKELRRLNIPYLMNGLDIEGTIEEKDEVACDKYVFADSTILDYKETDYPSSPIKIFRCFHFEDDFWSFMDMLKSPQKFMDRLFAQIDYSFGSDIKNVYQLNVNALADGVTFEKAKSIIEKTGGVVPSNSSEEILRAIKSQGVNPQWLQVASIMQQFVEDFAGGRSFQGLSEGSGESGKAINLKKQQGALITFLMLDNLARWKQLLGECALWFIKEYDSAERQIKVQGGELTPEMLQLLNSNGIVTPSQTSDNLYIKVNSGIEFLRDAELELTVTEAALTETEKEFKYIQLLEMGRSNPLMWQMPTYLQMLLEYNPDISSRMKKQLIGEMQQYNQQQQQDAQEDRNFEKAKLLLDAYNNKLGIQNARRNSAEQRTS